MSPLESVIGRASSERRVLMVTAESGLIDLAGRKLNESDISGFKSADVYLLAPSDKVLSKRITDSQKGLPLAQIAEEVLPFSASELVFASSANQENIYTIVRAEISAQKAAIEAQGLRLVGVAFSDGDEFVYTNQFAQEPAIAKRVSKVWLASALLASLIIVAGVAFLFHLETQKQNQLREELAQLQQQLDASPSNSTGLAATQVEMRDAAEVASTLKSLANSLTESTELDQLILTSDELVLDASSNSATQVQANLDQSAEFGSSEFVTSISRSANDASERFRLKLSLKGGQ